MAKDELRRLLDERGVDWDYGITGSTTTRFSVNGTDLTFTPMRDGLVCSTILTTEQAIAATLGDADLKAENAKLRELMQDTYDCICEMYKYMDGGYAYEDAEADPAYGPILKRMRELGVEVEP